MFFRTFAKLGSFTGTGCSPGMPEQIRHFSRPALSLATVNDRENGFFENDHTPAGAGSGGARRLLRGERGLFRPAIPRRSTAPARRGAVRRHGKGHQRHARGHGRRPPVDGRHVRRHARLFDQRGLPRADRQAHRGAGRETHRHARGLSLLRHDGHVADAARLRHRPLGRHRPGAGLRALDLFPTDHRRRAHHQDVGAGLCPADDGRCVDDPAGKHVGGRCAHGAHGVARNRRQPPADHLLFPPGHVRLLDQRGDRGLQGETPRGLLETHGGTRRRRHTRRRVEFLAPVVHRQPLEGNHARRLRAGLDLRDFAERAGARLRHGLELRTHGEPEPADPRLHGARIGHDLLARRRGGGRTERIRAARRRTAVAGLLGQPALHRRPDLPGRRGHFPRSAGHRPGTRTQQMVDRRRLGADAPAGMGTQPNVVHPTGLRPAARLQ